jgi:hypothetical protein
MDPCPFLLVNICFVNGNNPWLMGHIICLRSLYDTLHYIMK